MKAKFYLNQKLDEDQFDEAREYLLDDNMTYYLDDHLKRKIKKIEWDLKELDWGFINIETKEDLTTKDLEDLATFIEGQNSDGLGEGFNQQYFAEKEDGTSVIIQWGFDWIDF
jgi:hypothetical protein